MINGGEASKEFIIERRDDSSFLASVTTFNLSGGTYADTAANFDFNAGEYLITRIGPSANPVNNPNIILWVKWRE